MIQKYYVIVRSDGLFYRGTSDQTGEAVWSLGSPTQFSELDNATYRKDSLQVEGVIKTIYVITDIAAFETAILDARDKSTFYSEFFEDEFHEHFQKLLPE